MEQPIQQMLLEMHIEVLEKKISIATNALKGLQGLLQLLMGRADVPEEVKAAYKENHRWIAAEHALQECEGKENHG